MSANTAPTTDVAVLLVQRMNYLNQRQEVLAENVANGSTPGYKAHDLAPMSFGDTLQHVSVGMKTTDPRHIVPGGMAGVNAKTVKVDSPEVLPNGNNVDVSQQMLDVSKTAVDYQGITSIYKAITSMKSIALKGTK
jgi:flagellar basal-body rod protein FlgB